MANNYARTRRQAKFLANLLKEEFGRGWETVVDRVRSNKFRFYVRNGNLFGNYFFNDDGSKSFRVNMNRPVTVSARAETPNQALDELFNRATKEASQKLDASERDYKKVLQLRAEVLQR